MQVKPMRVRLYGFLAKEFGDTFELFVNTPAEAIRLLEANFAGRFYKAVRKGAYHVVKGPEYETGVGLTEEHIQLGGFAGDTLHIVPVVKGASNNKGIFAIIIGVVLIGAAILLSGGSLAAPLVALSSMTAGSFSGIVAAVGISLALGGVAQLLAPMPDSVGPLEPPKSKPSGLLGGPVNTTQPGNCVPLVYGQIRCGSGVVSAGITVVSKEN